MARVVWKGVISFGLVTIPINLYPATRSDDLSFSMLDKRDLAPVGYRRINKHTGKEVAWDQIVKGYEYEDDKYVVLSDEDIRQANPKATQTVEILSFVDQEAISAQYFDTPYYLEPGLRGEKGYALLCATLKKTNKIGIAQVVIRTKQHLAAVLPVGDMLLLNTLRYTDEIRAASDLKIPKLDKKSAVVSSKELDMAARLVEDMTEAWDSSRYRDTFKEDVLARVEQKIRAKDTHSIAPAEEEPRQARGAQVIDLMALLKKSLEGTGKNARTRPKQVAARTKSAPSAAARKKSA